MKPLTLILALSVASGSGMLLAYLLPFRKTSLALSALLALSWACAAWFLLPLVVGLCPVTTKAAVAAAAFCGIALAGYPPGLAL